MNQASTTVFATGFPGTLARRVVALLSRRAEVSTIVLCRTKDLHDARKYAEQLGGAVSVVAGDTEQIDFGLSGKEYLMLAERVTRIAHLEQPVSLSGVGAVSKARRAAREVIELGLAAQISPHIIALSHVDVAGAWTGIYSEQDLDLGQDFPGASGEDRFRAERIFRRFKDKLSVTIVRSGWIVGNAPDLCPLVELLLTLDEPSALPVKDRCCPVFLSQIDLLSTAVATLIDVVPTNEVRTLHLVAPDAFAIGDLAQQIKNTAAALVPEGFNLSLGARRSLRQMSDDQSWSAKDFFRQQPWRTKISSAYSGRFLETHNLTMPGLDDEELRQLVVAAVEKITGFKK